MADLAPLLTQQSSTASSSELRKIAQVLHATQRQVAQADSSRASSPGTSTCLESLHTGAGFDVEQIWGQLTMHTSSLTPQLKLALEHAAEGKVTSTTATSSEISSEDDDESSSEEEVKQKAAKEGVEKERERQKRKKANRSSSKKGAGKATLDREDAELEARVDALRKQMGMEDDGQDAIQGRKKKKKEEQQEAEAEAEADAEEGEDDEDADSDRAMEELYGEGNFDPDEEEGQGQGLLDEEDDEVEDEDDDQDMAAEVEEGEDIGEEGDEFHPHKGRAPRRRYDSAKGEPDEGEGGGGGGGGGGDDEVPALHAQIKALESKLLSAKDWSMRGQASATQRPENSLLAEDFTVEHGVKSLPAAATASADATASLEARVRRRIADASFDDAQPKLRLTTPLDLEATLTPLDGNKSALSLVDLYEKDYLEKARLEALSQDPASAAVELTEEQKREREVIHLWRELASLLDTLTNQHFTPKAILDNDLKVISANAAAAGGVEGTLQVEEAIPSASRHMDLLAPQDTAAAAAAGGSGGRVDGVVLAHKAAQELTREDRRKIRRFAKHQKHRKAVRMEKQQKVKELQKQKLEPPAPQQASAGGSSGSSNDNEIVTLGANPKQSGRKRKRKN